MFPAYRDLKKNVKTTQKRKTRRNAKKKEREMRITLMEEKVRGSLPEFTKKRISTFLPDTTSVYLFVSFVLLEKRKNGKRKYR